jgi:hypothetical protein
MILKLSWRSYLVGFVLNISKKVIGKSRISRDFISMCKLSEQNTKKKSRLQHVKNWFIIRLIRITTVISVIVYVLRQNCRAAGWRRDSYDCKFGIFKDEIFFLQTLFWKFTQSDKISLESIFSHIFNIPEVT